MNYTGSDLAHDFWSILGSICLVFILPGFPGHLEYHGPRPRPYQPLPGSFWKRISELGKYTVACITLFCWFALHRVLNLILSAGFTVACSMVGYWILHHVHSQAFTLLNASDTALFTLIGSVTVDLFILFGTVTYYKLQHGHWNNTQIYLDDDYETTRWKILPSPRWLLLLLHMKFILVGTLGVVVYWISVNRVKEIWWLMLVVPLEIALGWLFLWPPFPFLSVLFVWLRMAANMFDGPNAQQV